jgi:hypothetical protein
MAHLGSDTWFGVDEIEEDSDLRSRATAFLAAVNWEVLTSIASQIRGVECTLSDKYSLGHFNLVRRLTFADGVSWVVRLRLPDLPDVFGTREAMKAADCMGIEVATMEYIRYVVLSADYCNIPDKTDTIHRLNTNIPVPEVFGHDLSADNAVGAPYIFMSYIHGTVARDLQQAHECEEGVFRSPEQDSRFWRQMAEYHVQLASLTFDKIGSIHQKGDDFFIGPEIETGEGPWNTAQDYYSTLVRHKIEVAEIDAAPEVRERDSFSFPNKFMELMQASDTQNAGPFGLANRDFGVHNVLVDNEFNIVGFIDFDGVMAAPAAIVAQLPLFMDVSRPIPGHVETRELALARMEKTAHLLPKYVGLVREAAAQQGGSASTRNTSSLADEITSDAASIVQGLNAFGQHSGPVNDRWSGAYELLLQKK